MEVKNPLFIFGTGRCGSTIFHKVLTHHPHVAWLSSWCLRYPGRPERNRLAMRIIDMPLPARYVRKVIYPGEFYPFWEYYCKGFSEPCRDLYKEDVTDRTKAAVRKVMGKVLTPKRNRLLIKITGWPRIGFLKEIFPDAKFVHIYRDGRAVASSLLRVPWWSGWGGPANWRWGELTPEQRAKWNKYDKSFVVLAAIEWEILMAAYEKAKQTIPPEDLMDIRYEDLCQNPIEMFQMAVEFGALEWSPKFEATVKSFSLRNANDKWQRDLNDVQQRILGECLSDTLEEYGYT
jgi:hypothetical protein